MPTPHRLAFLDALRGLAALYVLVFHVMALPAPALASGPLLGAVIAVGSTGVALFFVLSAFSLCYTLPRHARSGLPLTSFYLHRLFRIAPLFLPLLALWIWWGRGDGAGPAAGEILANLSFSFALFAGWEAGIVEASWAIGMEMLFYAVFPLLARIIDSVPRACAAAAVASLACALALSGLFGAVGEAAVDGYGWLRHLPLFLYGMLTYQLFNALPAMPAARARRLAAASLWAGALLLLALVVGIARGAIGGGGAWVLFGLGYAGVLLGATRIQLGLLVNRVTTGLGRISYSLYLLHPPVVLLLVPVFRRLQAALPDPDLALLACTALTLALSVPLAQLAYRWIELPGIAAGQRLLARLAARHRAAPGVAGRSA